MSEENKSFRYTSSAKEREEIRKIRERYSAPQEKEADKMEQLRRLDQSVTRKGTAAALVMGIMGTLTMGTGMSLIMTEFGKILGTYSRLAMPVGIVLGLLGIALVALAWPIYDRITKKERARIAPEIIRLTDELLK